MEETQTAQTGIDEQALIARLFEYLEPKHHPWRADYMEKLHECYNFKELKQWSGQDEALLNNLDVPAVPIDRINRGLDTIDGIRDNSNSKTRVVKRELGDENIAKLLDKTVEQIEYTGNYEEVEDGAFANLKDVGIGISKVGYDPNEKDGVIWFSDCNIEDVRWKWGKSKTIFDSPLIIHSQMVDWEEAMMLAPERAKEIEGLKVLMQSEYEKIRDDSVTGKSTAVDYTSTGHDSGAVIEYPDQVMVHEFWIRQRIPLKRIGFIDLLQAPDGQGGYIPVPTPRMRLEPVAYQTQEGEQEQGSFVQTQYLQYVVISGSTKQNSILAKQGKAASHPFVAMCAEKKKNGAPRGYVEISIPHQRRINLSWAQKIAFNNKAIKSPIVTIGGTYKLEDIEQSSKLGSVLNFPMGTQVVSINQIPNVDLQAIEEGTVARQDMDFAAAATEAPMRGVAEPGASGLKLSLQQNAAITPLNKWVKALQCYKVEMTKRVLELVIQYYKPEKMARIVGLQEFAILTGLAPSPMGGMVPIPEANVPQFPLKPDILNYDVVVEQRSVSDFKKQQSFNAAMAMKGSGIPFDDEYIIKNAPISDTDGALASNQKARQDILNQLMAQNAMLQQQLGMALKAQPKTGNQKANAVRGANQPQAGAQSMLGGIGPGRP